MISYSCADTLVMMASLVTSNLLHKSVRTRYVMMEVWFEALGHPADGIAPFDNCVH